MSETLERWWRKTGNPLYVWVQIARLADGEPIPTWCLPYLKESAQKLTARIDFKSDPPPADDDVDVSVLKALGLARQGQKSAFKRIAADVRDMRTSHDEVREVMKARNVTVARAKDIINRGFSFFWC